MSRLLAIRISSSSVGMSATSSRNGLRLQLMNWCISRPNPFKRPRHFFCSGRSSCSSEDDELRGLVDSECKVINGWNISSEESKQVAVSIKDLTFLQEAVAACNSPIQSEFSEEATLISEALRANCYDLNDKTMGYLRQFRAKLNKDLVIEVMRLVKVPELALKFFIWSGRQIGYSHSTPTYDALLDVLCFNDNDSVPQHFLREIGDEDRELLGRLLNVLIRKCCRNGFWNKALEELGRLKDFGHRPSRTAYNALVQVLLSADKLDLAFLVHREMSDYGCSIDRITIGHFAHALCKAGRWQEALGLLEKENFMLDTVFCTQMISGLLEASLFEEGMSFLHRLRSNGYLPNVVTFRTMLSGFLKKKELGWCKRIINMMIMEGCCPSPSLFNSLLHAYCSAGDYVYAFKLLKKMDACGCKPGYVPCNIFIGGVCGRGEASSALVELAEKVYAEMLDTGVVLNTVNIVNFAECLCSMGKFDRAFRVIKEMMSKGFVPVTSTYTKVIGCLCQASKVEEAFLLFEEMKSNCLTPDVYTYTILIDTFCKVGLIQQARSWFDEMSRYGCTPNVVTYTALIHAYLKAKLVSEANKLFMSMLDMGCVPDLVTYSALIDGLCKAGNAEKACQIYSKMMGTCEGNDVDMYFGGNNASTSEPNVFTYGALVDGLCKVHKVAEARDLLDAMILAGHEPNNIVYDALIDGFCKVGKIDEAQIVLTRMSQSGHAPSVYTYSSLIDRLFKDKRLDHALKILSKMLDNSCAPNVVTYTEMVDGLCKVGKTDEAYKLFRMMEEKGCSPDVVTYTAMIDGLGKANKVDMCFELYNQMIAKGCAPNFITYSVLINHCCTVGFLDEALELLQEMKQTYWPRHVAGSQKVIEGFSRNFIASLGLLEEISKYSSVPMAPAYKILINSFYQAGRLDKAFELYKEVTSSSLCSSFFKLNTCSPFIEALCLASKVDKAFELYSDITWRGDEIPDLALLFCLINGLLRVEKWEEAMLLCYSICHMSIQWCEEQSTGPG